MSKENCLEIEKIDKIRSIENDCSPSLLILMATEEKSEKNNTTAVSVREEGNSKILATTISTETVTSQGGNRFPKDKIDRNNSLESNSSSRNNSRKKTRRGKSKRKSSKPYTKSQWQYHIPRILNMKRKVILTDVGQPLVPYNTNKFLMEDHMPHLAYSGPLAIAPKGARTPARTRDSSFSIDSEENYFYSLPEDEEEFLTKEFSNVYEDARCERLEAMTKAQLIQEFLQMEATVEQLTRRINSKRTEEKFADDRKLLEQKIKELATENSDLKRKLERKTNSRPNQNDDVMSTSSSEDSESDSDTSSNSSMSRGNSDSSTSGSIDMENEIDMTDDQPLLNGDDRKAAAASEADRCKLVPAIILQ